MFRRAAAAEFGSHGARGSERSQDRHSGSCSTSRGARAPRRSLRPVGSPATKLRRSRPPSRRLTSSSARETSTTSLPRQASPQQKQTPRGKDCLVAQSPSLASSSRDFSRGLALRRCPSLMAPRRRCGRRRRSSRSATVTRLTSVSEAATRSPFASSASTPPRSTPASNAVDHRPPGPSNVSYPLGHHCAVGL